MRRSRWPWFVAGMLAVVAARWVWDRGMDSVERQRRERQERRFRHIVLMNALLAGEDMNNAVAPAEPLGGLGLLARTDAEKRWIGFARRDDPKSTIRAVSVETGGGTVRVLWIAGHLYYDSIKELWLCTVGGGPPGSPSVVLFAFAHEGGPRRTHGRLLALFPLIPSVIRVGPLVPRERAWMTIINTMVRCAERGRATFDPHDWPKLYRVSKAGIWEVAPDEKAVEGAIGLSFPKSPPGAGGEEK